LLDGEVKLWKVGDSQAEQAPLVVEELLVVIPSGWNQGSKEESANCIEYRDSSANSIVLSCRKTARKMTKARSRKDSPEGCAGYSQAEFCTLIKLSPISKADSIMPQKSL